MTNKAASGQQVVEGGGEWLASRVGAARWWSSYGCVTRYRRSLSPSVDKGSRRTISSSSRRQRGHSPRPGAPPGGGWPSGLRSGLRRDRAGVRPDTEQRRAACAEGECGVFQRNPHEPTPRAMAPKTGGSQKSKSVSVPSTWWCRGAVLRHSSQSRLRHGSAFDKRTDQRRQDAAARLLVTSASRHRVPPPRCPPSPPTTDHQ